MILKSFIRIFIVLGYNLKYLSAIACLLFFSNCINKNNYNNKQTQITDTLVNKSIAVNATSLSENELSNNLTKKRDSLLFYYKNYKRFSYIEKITIGFYSMEVETFCLNDSLSFEDSYNLLSACPIIEKQRLIFKTNKIISKSFFIPLKSKYIKNYKGEKIKTKDVNIWEINVLHGKTDSIFSIYGSGLCGGNLCPEFIGFYSKQGLPIFQSYVDKYDKRKVDEIFNNIGISDSIYKKQINNGIRIDKFWN